MNTSTSSLYVEEKAFALPCPFETVCGMGAVYSSLDCIRSHTLSIRVALGYTI